MVTRRTPQVGDSYTKGTSTWTVLDVGHTFVRVAVQDTGDAPLWVLPIVEFQRFIAKLTWGVH